MKAKSFKNNYAKLVAIVAIGLLLLLSEAYIAGIFSQYFVRSPAFHTYASSWEFYLRELGFSLMLWATPSLIAAYLISLIQPRRWLLYSALAITPDLLSAIYGLAKGLSVGIVTLDYYIVSSVVHLLVLPALLGLIYLSANFDSGKRLHVSTI